MKTALVNCADTGPLESLALMLGAAGYRCVLPGPRLQDHLKGLGCDTVISVDHLVKNWGYDPPADPSNKDRPFETYDYTPGLDKHVDLYVDVKAHRNGPKVWAAHPNLKDKTLWYRINGGEPEHVLKKPLHCGHCPTPNGCDWWHLGSGAFKCSRSNGLAHGEDHGDEINPPCPVLTPNRWYAAKVVARFGSSWEKAGMTPGYHEVPAPWADKAYSCWPPFARVRDYLFPRKEPGAGCGSRGGYDAPLALVHNAAGWGYADLLGPLREVGVRVHGVGSPDGLINHREVGVRLSTALAYVHLKSNDAPGYALYEALAAGCPVIIPKRLIWRCRMQELFVGGRTCLTFDRETHDPLSPEDVRTCTEEIEAQLTSLANVDFNQKVGEAGRERLKEVMWRADRDGDSFREFMRRNFGG